MLVHLSVHRPKPGREQELIDSMHRFGRGDGDPFPGRREALTLRDRDTGTLVGLAIWESEEAFRAGVPRMRVRRDGKLRIEPLNQYLGQGFTS